MTLNDFHRWTPPIFFLLGGACIGGDAAFLGVLLIVFSCYQLFVLAK